MTEYAPSEELQSKIFEATSYASPPGDLERLLWTMSIEHLAYYAVSEDIGPHARPILEVRLADSVRRTNLGLVAATWALVLVTALLAVAAVWG